MKSYKSDEIVYTPRPNREVLNDLAKGNLPFEIKEQQQLIDVVPEPIKHKVLGIIQRISKANQLTGDRYQLNIQISNSAHENAAIITHAKQPLLIITKGLLCNVKSEDELAGIIAHELGHLILHETAQDADHHNKIEETAADNLGVKLVAIAGYDPRAIIYFLQRAGHNEAHLVDPNGVQAEVEKMIQIMTDPHPTDENRIRSMETTLSVLSRSGTIASFAGNLTELPVDFYASASQISYTAPLTAGMNNIAYADKSIIEKISILTELLRSLYLVSITNYKVGNTTADKRLIELTAYISNLEVDFTDQDQRQAFIGLTDVLLIKHPENLRFNTINYDKVIEAMVKVWKKDGNNSEHIGRYQDLRDAQDQFKQAKTEKEADESAAKIINLSNRLNLLWYKAPSPFTIPSEAEIKCALAKDEIYTPIYSAYISWYEKNKSENIKTVLLSMKLDYDPQIVDILGGGEYEQLSEAWLPQNNQYYGYLPNYKRTSNGSITGNMQLSAYQWKLIDKNASKEEIIRHQEQEAENIKQYQQNIVRDCDWSLLRRDFSRFINQYLFQLVQYFSLVPITYPFAEKFYEVLSEELIRSCDKPDSDSNDVLFLMQVMHFFSRDKHIQPLVPFNYREIFLMGYRVSVWPYNHVPQPALFKQSDRIIKFILNPRIIPILTDDTRIDFLERTEGMYQPDPKTKISSHFTIPLDNIVVKKPKNSLVTYNLPIFNIQYLIEHSLQYSNIALLLEIERIAYAYQDIMNLTEYLLLNMLYQDYVRYIKYLSLCTDSLSNLFSQLKLPSIQRSISSTDASNLIMDYQMAIVYEQIDEFANLHDEFYMQIKSVLNGLSSTDKQKYLRELVNVKNIDLGNNANKRYHVRTYQGYIPDPQFRHWVIEEYTNTLASELNEDNGSKEYYDKAVDVIDDITKNTKGLMQFNILSYLASKINAQKNIAYYIRDSIKLCSLDHALSLGLNSIFGEILVNECNSNLQFRSCILGFLSEPLTPSSTDIFHQNISQFHNLFYASKRRLNHENIKAMLDNELRRLHKNFTSSTLEIKTIYLETLLFPTNSNKEFQNAMIKEIISLIFPIEQYNNESGTNQLAQLIIKSYLDSTDLNERRLLTTALFVANIKEQEAQEISTGLKLNRVLSNMGPAGGKLLQAIHSHPQTPEVIKRDLASSKTQFSQPSRWDLVELVDKSGLLETTTSNPNPVRNIGKIVGSGSFGITVFNTLEDGALVADTFLRENAGVQAQREFGMMHTAAQNIVAQKPAMKPVINMIEEGKRSAVAETDMAFAQTANRLAEQAYEQFNLIQVDSFQFTHQVAHFLARGESFKRIEIAPGQHFNDLDNSAYKTAIAKAMIVTQLTLRLAGINTDLDRHGGNIKVEGSVITHFDFGAMNLEAITSEDKMSTGKVLAQAVFAVAKINENFSDALLTSIQNISVSEASRNYLNGLNKDFLALGDYINTVTAQELPALLAYCLTAKTVDAQIKAAFKEELGIFAELFELNLQWKARSAGIEIISSNDNKVASRNTQCDQIIQGKPSDTGFFSKINNATDTAPPSMQMLAASS